jgi:hypothetical protein
MENNFISEKFVFTNRITTKKHLKVLLSLKMVVKESGSIINYKVKPVIQISLELGEISKVFASSLED